MNLRDVLEIAGMVVTLGVAWLALRFSNQALQGRIDLMTVTQDMRASFDTKLEKLSEEVNKLRNDLDRQSFSERFASIERRLRLSERDHHWSRNMFSNILIATLSEEKRDAIVSKVDKYIASRYEGLDI
jgi:hypothetical protein